MNDIAIINNIVIMITQLTTLFGVSYSIYSSWLNRKIAQENRDISKEIHVSINSRMDQLLKLTGTSERAAGVKEERDRKGT